MLLPKFLETTDTVLVMSFNLPVLIRIKIEQIINLILPLIIIAIMSEYLEAPLRHLNLLCSDAILDLARAISLNFFDRLSLSLSEFERYLAVICVTKVRVLLDLLKHHALSQPRYLLSNKIILYLSDKQLNFFKGWHNLVLVPDKLDVFAGCNNLDAELGLNVSHILNLSLNGFLNKGANQWDLFSPIFFLFSGDQVLNGYLRIVDILALADIENLVFRECNLDIIFILYLRQLIEETVKYRLFHDK